MLEDLIKEELVKSMKERDALRVLTLRMINASIKDLEISRRSSNSNQIKDIMNDKEPRPPEDWDSNDDSSDDTTPSSDIGGPATEH